MGTARRKPTPLLTVFMDLGRFAAHTQRVEDSEIAETLDSYYQRVAMLESIGITLSAEAFRKLSPELRKKFKKNTWPVTYIGLEDPRPLIRKGGRAIWA